MRRHLLPRNATPIERAVSETIDRLPELAIGADDVRGFKFDPTDLIIPHLTLEYGLGEIEDFLPDPAQILHEGIVWQRLRGTPASLHRALRWIDADGTLEENPVTRFKWWWFQVHLGGERRNSFFVTPMIALANASKPLRSEFARVTAGFDVRGFTLNEKRMNGGGLLNSWSGVRRAAVEPVLSFRVRHRDQGFAEDVMHLDMTHIHRVRHANLVDGGPPTEQRSGFPSAFATGIGDSTDPRSVPFNNAPFSEDHPFGAPTPMVQALNTDTGRFIFEAGSTADHEILGYGIEGNLGYVDIKVSATASGLRFVSLTSPNYGEMLSVVAGQQATTSAYVSLLSGSLGYCELAILAYKADWSNVDYEKSQIEIGTGGLATNLQSFTHAIELADAAMANGWLMIGIEGPGEAVVRVHINPMTVE
jgi:P2-related tail formation protein